MSREADGTFSIGAATVAMRSDGFNGGVPEKLPRHRAGLMAMMRLSTISASTISDSRTQVAAPNSAPALICSGGHDYDE